MRGRFELYAVGPRGPVPLGGVDNDRVDSWMHLVARACTDRGRASPYALSHIYVEFENVAAPGDPAAAAAIDPAETSPAYYRGLAAPRDYLRAPILGPVELDVAPGFGHLPPALGNRALLRAYASGAAGANGVPFGAAHNSTICGLAVVAAVGGEGDPTRDLLFARAYYPAAAQRIPPDGAPLLVTYQTVFGPDAGGS